MDDISNGGRGYSRRERCGNIVLISLSRVMRIHAHILYVNTRTSRYSNLQAHMVLDINSLAYTKLQVAKRSEMQHVSLFLHKICALPNIYCVFVSLTSRVNISSSST